MTRPNLEHRRSLARALIAASVLSFACTPQRDAPTTAPPTSPTIAGPNSRMPSWEMTKVGEACFSQLVAACAPEDPMCRPPAKQPYRCPTWQGGPVELPMGGRIDRDGDQCTLFIHSDPCPPQAACNPVPPVDVDCPDR